MSDSLTPSLRIFLNHLTSSPGVYRMLDESGNVLYVGKASNLKKRVSSYFNKQSQGVKTRSLVQQIQSIDVTVTHSETEALLLECQLIKSLRPKYNVLMRDDKSYPYIHLTSKHPFPSITSVRLKKVAKEGDYFGPYPSTLALREALHWIQKVFKIRNCSEPYFNARTRPCLQYQIKRCTAPCVGLISQSDYHQAVVNAKQLLQGKSQIIIEELTQRMIEAVARLDFEQAAVLRDQIKQLRVIQEQQGVMQIRGDLDAIAIEARPGFACVQCVTIRNGQVLSNQTFFPSVPNLDLHDEEATLLKSVFSSFVAYYYVDNPKRIPAFILLNQSLDDASNMASLLSELRLKACKIVSKPRGTNAKWLAFAVTNLQQAIAEHVHSAQTMMTRYQHLCSLLNMPYPIKRMECFDISHTQGQDTVASCVVFDQNGPCKREYRRFLICDITPGDDYAAMEQALLRRFKRLMVDYNFPDLLIIDGGKGQLNVAKRVLNSLNIHSVVLLGIAKGADRKAGYERLFIEGHEQDRTLPMDSQALHLLQHIRNEAHRFAIQTHREKRQKTSRASTLESIPGIGAKKRQALLARFGGIRELSKAPLAEIQKVPGIGAVLAQMIYEHFK